MRTFSVALIALRGMTPGLIMIADTILVYTLVSAVWSGLLGAYYREFGRSEPVELVLKTRAFHSSDDFEGLIASFVAERGLPRGRRGRASVRVLGDELSLELPPPYSRIRLNISRTMWSGMPKDWNEKLVL